MLTVHLRLLALSATGLALVGVGSWALARATRGPAVPPRALSPAELQARFGPIRWHPSPTPDNPEAITVDNEAEWNARLETVQLELPNAPGARARVHRAIAPRLQALVEAWRRAGVLADVLSFDGVAVARRVRGSQDRLSSHAFGVSFDVNAAQNALGSAGAPAGSTGSVARLVPIAEALGWAWGGRWQRPDPMHFEIGA